jgi:hypothetical protein
MSSVRSAVALLALLAGACTTPIESSARFATDPVVRVHGAGGEELGVSTDYGVVFLGRSARSGRVEFTAWFGDGPAREVGVVEAVGGGAFATESEILLPRVALCFEPPEPGSSVRVRGRRGDEPFEIEAELAADARVTGLLLASSPELERLTDAELGAGVFLVRPGEPLELLGLVSGRLAFDDGRRYVTVLGPDDLWRLVVQRRNSDRPRRALYRDDVR